MRRLLIFLCPVLLVFGILASAGAVVIDFEDITTDDTRFIPRTHGDFFYWEAGEDGPDYYEWAVVSDAKYKTYGNTYDPPSGDYAAFNEAGDESLSLNWRSSSTDFYFVGAYFTSWAVLEEFGDDSATTIRIEGWNDAINVWNLAMDLSPDTYDWLAAGSLSSIAVDELRFIAPPDRKYWLMDDLTYSTTVPTTVPTPVPEPCTMLLLGTGLVGFAVPRIRRKLKK